MTHFGPGGNCDMFYAEGNKSTTQIPAFLDKLGLDAYEIQCGRGVRMKEDAAALLGKGALKHNIHLSVHAPYYISMSGIEEEKRLKSIDYILQSARLAKNSGATRVVLHTGSCSKISREQALALAMDTMQKTLDALKSEGLTDIFICPETMGKINQLGTLEEVLTLCSLSEQLLPAIDFGHLNARTNGSLKSEEDYAVLLDQMEDAIGTDRAKVFHSHFSKIEYTAKGGEVRHLTFDDDIYGPDFEPLANQLIKRDYSPTIICESAGTMSRDALKMQQIYHSISENK